MPFRNDDRPSVDVVPVGDVDDAAVDAAVTAVSEEYDVDPAVRQSVDPPPQEEGIEIYEWTSLVETVEDVSDADVVLGVTAAPIYGRDVWNPFGVGFVGERAGLVSKHPLEADEADDLDVVRERIGKQAVKQVARTFGLAPEHDDCVATSAETVSGLDTQPASLCSACRARLSDPRKGAGPPHWIVSDPDVEWPEAITALAAIPGLFLRVPGRLFGEAFRLGVLRPLAGLRSAVGGFAIPSPNVSLPRTVRKWIHESYRTARLGMLVAVFLATVLLVLKAEFWLYRRAVGVEAPIEVGWVLIVVGLVVGLLLQWILRGLIAALVRWIYARLREGWRDGVRTDPR